MISQRLVEAATTGAKRAGVHAMRAASELVAAVLAFADEIGGAFGDDAEDDDVEHIPVEPQEGE